MGWKDGQDKLVLAIADLEDDQLGEALARDMSRLRRLLRRRAWAVLQHTIAGTALVEISLNRSREHERKTIKPRASTYP